MANLRRATAEGLGGAAGGALTGATIGSVVPGIGTLIGAGVGGLVGLFGGSASGLFEQSAKSKQREYMKKQKKQMNKTGMVNAGQLPSERSGNLLTGYDPYVSTASKLNPAQQSSQQELLPYATDRIKNAPSFEDIRQETLRHHRENVLPGIIEGFSARGSSKLSSPQLSSALRGGEHSLQTQLNAQRAQYELGQQQNAQNLYGTLMGSSQESFYNPAQPGFAQEFGGQVLGKATEIGLDLGGEVLKKWATSTPQQKSAVMQKIGSLNPAQKQQFAAFLKSPSASQYPAAIKNQIGTALQPQSTGMSTAGKVGLGLAGAAATGYIVTKAFDHLLGE